MSSSGNRTVRNDRHRARRYRPMLLLLFLAFLPGSGSGDGGLPPGTGTRGVQVTREVPFASETLDAVRSAAPGRPTRAREDRAIPRHRIDRDPLAGPYGVPAMPLLQEKPFSVPAAAPVAPRAPVLDASFEGLGNPPHSQGDVIPPDTMGAAGPNHLVSLLNSAFGVFDKSNGTLLQSKDLASFWAFPPNDPRLPPDFPDFPYDTKVLYDQHSNRFVAVTLDCTVAGNSWVMVAVSSSADPTASWYKWAIPSDLDNTTWADYPGLGLDAANVYITANMFNNNDFYQYSKVWVIPKAQLLSGSNPITWTEFPDPAGSGPSMQPAHTFGTPGEEYFIYEGGTNQLQLARIENVTGTPVWRLLSPAAVAPYTYTNSLPGAPQAGDTRTIDTSDTRLLNAVFRNGFVWTTHTVAVNGKTEVAWYRINPAASPPTVAAGRIRDTVRWYYYPSIAVNQDNVAAIGFSGSSAVEYVGGYYTILRPPYLAAEPASLLKSGAAPYYKTLSGIYNRWGDFSATVVDPTDDTTFWTLQEYAMTPDSVTLASRWGTWWGNFHPSDVTAPVGLTAAASPGPQVVLSWTDTSLNETGFKIERRRLPGQDYEIIRSVDPNVTTFTDNASTGLLGGFSYSYRVQALYATGGSYSAEAFATTVAPPPPPSSGGGGGCLAITPSAASTADASSILSLLVLFLPAAVYGCIRRVRTGNP